MIDTSGSMTLILDRVKDAAEQFLIRLLPEDRVGLARSTTRSSSIPSDGSPAIGTSCPSLKELDFGYPTRLWDAVTKASRAGAGPGRQVMLVFTDGADTASRRDLDDVLIGRDRQGVMVYAIGLIPRSTPAADGSARARIRASKKLSEETGGGFYLLKNEDELGPTFTRVAQELHSQYVLGFSPAALDGKVHKLEVK